MQNNAESTDTDDFQRKIFGHTCREVIMSSGESYTPNDFVDMLYDVEYDPRSEGHMTLKLLAVAGAIECQDQLDEEHHAKLLTIAELAFVRGLECVEGLQQ